MTLERLNKLADISRAHLAELNIALLRLRFEIIRLIREGKNMEAGSG